MQQRMSAKLQIVVTPEILDVLDDHARRLAAINPGTVINRSTVARAWLELGYPHATARLEDAELRAAQAAHAVTRPVNPLPKVARGRPPRR